MTLSAVNDETDSPDKTVTVSGAASGGWGLVADPASADLTIQDDDSTPSAGLVLSPFSISENGDVSTVTARLNRPSSEAVTAHRVRGAGGERGRGRLCTERGEDPDHRGGLDDEHGVGDGGSGGQRRSRGSDADDQAGDGVGDGRGRPRGHVVVSCDAGRPGGRGDTDGDAAAVAAGGPGERGGVNGDGEVESPVKRGGDGHGRGRAGRGDGGRSRGTLH